MKIVWEVQESFLNAALDEIQTRHNGIQNYLHSQLGLTPAAQSKLQSLYLA
jgi:protein-tyrosine phosphatase